VLPFNIVFGLCASWCIAKFNFFGKNFLLTLIDLPFSISAVVVGLMFSLCLNNHSVLGKFCDSHNVQVLFAFPSMVIVTLFATLPLISKVLIPLMQQQGNYYEEAAASLGARGFKIFWHLTLPNIIWYITQQCESYW
jgi:sulfate transport system permease protein